MNKNCEIYYFLPFSKLLTKGTPRFGAHVTARGTLRRGVRYGAGTLRRWVRYGAGMLRRGYATALGTLRRLAS
jgi:hypothetical protein